MAVCRLHGGRPLPHRAVWVESLTIENGHIMGDLCHVPTCADCDDTGQIHGPDPECIQAEAEAEAEEVKHWWNEVATDIGGEG